MNRNIIVIGASAGGVEAIPRLLSSITPDVKASFFVTLHISAEHESLLPKLISRQGYLPALHPTDGMPIRPGHIYVAPPDYHLMVGPGVVHLRHGPKENRHRPAIDPMFRSAAKFYGEQVAGVLLTGYLDDGVAGLSAIQQQCGLAIVQDPAEARYPEMPRNALRALRPDYCLPLEHIEDLIKRLPGSTAKGGAMKRKKGKKSNQTLDIDAVPPTNGKPVALVCPECLGPLWEFHHGKLTRFQCLVGHRYTLASLLDAHSEELEAALWIALRTLEERINLQRRLVEQARTGKHDQMRRMFETKAQENLKHAKLLRNILEKMEPG